VGGCEGGKERGRRHVKHEKLNIGRMADRRSDVAVPFQRGSEADLTTCVQYIIVGWLDLAMLPLAEHMWPKFNSGRIVL